MPPVVTTETMTTRDGVELVADVYRPAAEGAWPTLLHRTPYDRTDPTLVAAIVADPLWLARQGFAVVVQDVRGRFASGGEMDFAAQEVEDGYDAVEWAAAQPWSDGAVGIYGSSYHAIAALNAVAAGPPHLRAALAMIGGADAEATSWPGGTFELGFLALYSLGQTVDTLRRAGRTDLLPRVQAAAADPLGTVSTLPLDAVDVLDEPGVAPSWQERLAHEPGDPWWHRHPSVHRDPSLVTVPLLQVAAYRDFLSPPMFRLAEQLGAPHRLVAGPWAHGGAYTGHTGARVLSGTPGGVGTWGPLIAAWFDVHLRGGSGPHRFLTGDPVHYYLGGEDRWASAPGWPPASSGSTWSLPDLPATVRADPHDPVPTVGGAMSAPPLGPDGIQDQRVLDGRDDVLVRTSDVLTEAVTITGRPTLTLTFSSTAVDADVCVTLVDVEPDGYAVPVAEGALRTRYRFGGTGDLLTPGEPVDLVVTLHDTAHVFRAGHRIRVQVAGSSYPRRSRNLHTSTVPERGTLDEAVVATHTVWAGALVSTFRGYSPGKCSQAYGTFTIDPSEGTPRSSTRTSM